MSALAGALIAGGLSSRFGEDKARLAWADGSLGGHLLRQMQAAGLEPLVLNAAVALADAPLGVTLCPDTEAGQGPLGGLASALRLLQRPVLIAACDMPGLDARAFETLSAAWKEGQRGLIARGPDGWQPLFGIYSPELLPLIEQRLAQGQRALYRLIEDEGLDAWDYAEPAWLANVNTREDWEAWKVRQAE